MSLKVIEVTLGQFVRYRRGRLGLTQEQVADRMPDHSATWVSRIETDTRREIPSPEDLRALADALDCRIEELLQAAGYLDEPSPSGSNGAAVSSPHLHFFAANSDKLTDEEWDALERIAEQFIKAKEGRS